MLEEIQDMQGEIFDLDDWGHPLAECWHDMELNEPAESDDDILNKIADLLFHN